VSGRQIARDEVQVTWLILCIMWSVLIAQVMFEPHPRVVGLHLLLAGAAPLLFLVLSWKWGFRQLALGEWLLLPTTLALLATLDFDALPASTIGYAGLAALFAPFVRHLTTRR
jgi:hypothetical protein